MNALESIAEKGYIEKAISRTKIEPHWAMCEFTANIYFLVSLTQITAGLFITSNCIFLPLMKTPRKTLIALIKQTIHRAVEHTLSLCNISLLTLV